MFFESPQHFGAKKCFIQISKTGTKNAFGKIDKTGKKPLPIFQEKPCNM